MQYGTEYFPFFQSFNNIVKHKKNFIAILPNVVFRKSSPKQNSLRYCILSFLFQNPKTAMSTMIGSHVYTGICILIGRYSNDIDVVKLGLFFNLHNVKKSHQYLEWLCSYMKTNHQQQLYMIIYYALLFSFPYFRFDM